VKQRRTSSDDDALVSLADVAEMAGVTRPAVSNWRRRNPDFPSPVRETGATSLFRLADLRLWMRKHGKQFEIPSVEQLLWSWLNRIRDAVLPEEAAEAGMILLGYMAMAAQLGEKEVQRLRTAVMTDGLRTLEGYTWPVAGAPHPLALAESFTPDNQLPRWTDSGTFLTEVLDLALTFGAGEVFEALVAAAARGSRGAGQYTTPSSVARLVMALASPISGVVLDPACGQGTFLLAASEKASSQLTLIGQDINSRACLIARLRMLVHGLSAEIVQGDSLAVRALGEGPQADLIVADPPMGAYWAPEGTPSHERLVFGASPPPSRAEMVWLQHGISRLRPDGLAIFLLPMGSLFWGRAEGEIRRRLIEARCLHAVIALPRALYPTTGIQVALWIVGRPAKAKEDVLLVDASKVRYRHRSRAELTDADVTAINDCFRAWLKNGELPDSGVVKATTVPVNRLLDENSILDPAHWIEDLAESPAARLNRVIEAERVLHSARNGFSQESFAVPSLIARDEEVSDSWPTKKISDLATLFRPRRIDPDLIGTGTTPLIRPRDLGPDLTVTWSEKIDLKLMVAPVELTQPGDVIVLADGRQLRAAVDQIGDAIAAAPLQVVRPRSESIDSIVLAALIVSIGSRNAVAVGSAARHINLSGLEVPFPDPSVTSWLRQALDTLGEQRRQASAAVQAIDQLSSDLVQGLSSRALKLDTTTADGEGV
jgi:SAM-dependent methyltransferase/predicted DNA-binding transcriptional regulator AlpA